MHNWLTSELEYKKHMESLQNLSSQSVVITNIWDSYDIPNPENITSVCFENDCFQSEESVSIIYRFPNIKRITFGTRFNGAINSQLVNAWIDILPHLSELGFFTLRDDVFSWETLAALNLSQIKKLHIRLVGTGSTTRLCAPNLEEFYYWGDYEVKLTPMDLLATPRTYLDFSGMPILKNVKLHNCGLMDYTSLNSLRQLSFLDIEDHNLSNISWLSNDYSLDTLLVSGCVTSLSGIESQPNLHTLYLGCNKLTDISPISSLHNLRSLDLRANNIADPTPIEALNQLEYLNLDQNPLVNEGNLRQMKISTLLITPLDYQLSQVHKLVNEFSNWAYLRIRSEDNTDVTCLPEYSRKRILTNRIKPYKDRLVTHIQQAFEVSFSKVNPFDLHSVDYDMSFKAEYLRYAVERYPFLLVTGKMKDAIRRESSLSITRIPQKPGIVFYLGEDLVRIYVRICPGNGHLTQKYDTRYFPLSFVHASKSIHAAIKKHWKDFFGNNDMCAYDIDVTYAPLFEKEVDAKIAVAVLYAIWSAYYEIIPKHKTALIMRYSPSGKLVRDKITAHQLNIASLQGIEKIICCGRKTEEAVQKGVLTCAFSNLDDFKNCLSSQALEYEKLRELDTFQQELLNVITRYFSDITNHNQLRSILKDCFPTKTRDINLLILLIQMNILQKIKNQDKIDTLFVNNLVSLMESEHAIMADNARYAVNTWCLCYGKYTLGKKCDLGNSQLEIM